MNQTNTPNKMTYSHTTNLFSDYKLPTGEARYEFAQFRTRAMNLTTRELHSVWASNKNAVSDYKDTPSLQHYCITAAARRDFCAAVLNGMRGVRFDYATDSFAL
jgi:hypothetical protein